MVKRSIFAVLLWLAGCHLLRAQSFDYGFKHLTTDNGLSHDNIHCITRDKQGFIWFGTMNGLNRFDGLQFHTFTNSPNDTTSLVNNYVTTAACDDNGYLWVATSNGV